MSIERLTPDDMSWTNHSIHAEQYHMQNMYHYHDTSIHNYNCPLDPCRTTSLRGSLLPLKPLRDDDEYFRRREAEEKARKERREREENERRERDRYVIEENERRNRREKGETSDVPAPRPQTYTPDTPTPPPTPVEYPSTPKYTSKDLYRDTFDSTSHSISDSRQAATIAYNEARDALNVSGLHNFLNKGNAISSQFASPKDSLVVQTAVAAYSLIATVATHNLAAYRADIYDRERQDFADDMLTVAKEHQAAARVNQQTSFAEYQSAVADAKGYERAAMTTLEQTRDSKIETAQSVQTAAETKYKTSVADIEREQAREMRTYTATLQGIDAKLESIQNSTGVQSIRMERQEKLDNAQAVYTSKKDEILQRRETALAEIDPSTPIAAAQRREVSARFDKDLSTLDAQYTKDVARIEKTYTERETNKIAKYDRNAADLQAQRAQLVATHQQASQDFESKLAGARTERDSAVAKAKQDVARAQSEFKDGASRLSESVSTRLTELEKPKNIAERAADKANRAVLGAELARNDDKAAKQLKNTLSQQQTDLSRYLVSRLGTKEEKQLVDAYFDDKRKEDEAKKTGKMHVSSLSESDKEEVEHVLERYGNSDFKSVESIESSVAKMQQMLPKLEATVKQDAADLAKATQVVQGLQSKRQGLLDKVGGDTDKLSAADKKSLGKLDKDLAKAKSAEKRAAGKLENSTGALNLLKSQAAMMLKHKGILPKIGTDTRQKLENKQGADAYKKATQRVQNSLTGALSALNKATGVNNNAIMKSEHEFRGSIHKIRKDIDFAAKSIIRTTQVSIIATKMLYRGGSILAKGTHVFLSKSPMYRATMQRFAAQAAKHPGMLQFLGGVKGFTKDGAQMLGKAAPFVKKAMFVPGKVVGAVATVATLNVEDIERGILKGAGNLAMKGVRVGTKKATNAVKKKAGQAIKKGAQKGREKIRVGKQKLKNGARTVGKGAKFVGRKVGGAFSRRFGQSKVWKSVSSAGKAVGRGLGKVAGALGKVGKALMAPFKALGSILTKIISILSSILSSVMGAIGSILASVGALLLQGVILLVIFIILIVILFSVLDAIYAFFKDMLASTKIKISYDPSFIMNLGSNYRNVELSILEFFSEEKGWTSNDAYNNKIECNDDPLYYAVFNNSFDWFGLADDGKDINQYKEGAAYRRHVNEEAYKAFTKHFENIKRLEEAGKVKHLSDGKKFWETLCSWAVNMYNAVAKTLTEYLEPGQYGTFGDVWEKQYASAVKNIERERFHSLVTTYDRVSAQYYIGAKSDRNAIASSYEVSNAKDAMAMMDAIYTMDVDMTRTKVLRYLGVGEYQLTQHEVPAKALKDRENLDNLFWKTHQIEYTCGTSRHSIVFHPQQSTDVTSDGVTKVGKVNGTLSVNDPGYGILTKECDNYATIGLSYTLQSHADGKCGQWEAVYKNNHFLRGSTFQDVGFHLKKGYITLNMKPDMNTAKYTTLSAPAGMENGTSKTYMSQVVVTCGKIHKNRKDKNGNKAPGPCRWTVYGTVPASGIKVTYYKDYTWHEDGAVYDRYLSGYTWKKNYTCPHKEQKNEEFQYCLGHAALKANIYVTVGDPPGDQTTIYDVAKTLSSRTYHLGNGIWTWSSDLDLKGWGSPGPETITPSTEWSDEALIGLASGKIKEPLEYYSETGYDISPMTTKHGEASGPQVLIWPDSESLLHHALYFKENTFYQSDFMSGEQVDLAVKEDNPNGPIIYISFVGAPNGVRYLRVNPRT